MVVAAGAGDGRALESFGKGVDLVINDVVTDLFEVVVPHLPKSVEGGPDRGFIELLRRVPPLVGQEIAGDVLAHELVVRNVLVERSDEVVAVPPRLFHLVVPLVT